METEKLGILMVIWIFFNVFTYENYFHDNRVIDNYDEVGDDDDDDDDDDAWAGH